MKGVWGDGLVPAPGAALPCLGQKGELWLCLEGWIQPHEGCALCSPSLLNFGTRHVTGQSANPRVAPWMWHSLAVMGAAAAAGGLWAGKLNDFTMSTRLRGVRSGPEEWPQGLVYPI